MTKLFILASERSGTNLLRSLIGNHNDIDAPVAPHFFNEFYKKLHLYGQLTDKENQKFLIGDMLALANHPYHAWDISVNIDKLIAENDLSSLAKIVDKLYMIKAEREGKTGYCSKGIHNFNHVHFIKGELPTAKFVYLVRDPRDHASSWLKTPLFLHTPFQIIKKWNREQLTCRKLLTIYSDDIFLIRYEDLISDPAGVMTNFLNFLNVEVDENCFSTDTTNKESKRNEFWKNLSKPIMKDNKKKYLKTLDKDAVNLIETLASANMKALGYTDFSSSRDWEMGNPYLFKVIEFVKKEKSRRKRPKKTQEVMEGIQSKMSLIKSINERLQNR